MTTATITVCPGCGSEKPETCGCIPGLDYPEAPAEASTDEAEIELAPDTLVLDVTNIDQAWIEEQVEKQLSLLAERERLRDQYLARSAAKDREIAEHQERTQHLMQAWFDAQPKKGRFIDLATGRLRKKANKGGPRVEDEAAALAWAEENKPELVTPITTKKLDKKAFCALADAARSKDGEILPGVEFREDWDSFLIEAPKASGEEV